MTKPFVKYAGWFLGLLFLQVVILNNLQIGKYVFPFCYVLFMLFLPKNTPKWSLLLIGFSLGSVIDLFIHSYGTHAFACTLLAFIRPYVLDAISPKNNSTDSTQPSVQSIGFQNFLVYAGILVFVHHLLVFFIEELRVDSLLLLLSQVVLSSITSVFVIVCLQFIFNPKNS